MYIGWFNIVGLNHISVAKIPVNKFFVGRLKEGDEPPHQPVDAIGVYLFHPGVWYLHTGYSNPVVSRRHLLVEKRASKLLVKDHGVDGKGSTGGTWVNGRRLEAGEERLVKPGDVISLAQAFDIHILGFDEAAGKPKLVLRPAIAYHAPTTFVKRLRENGYILEVIEDGDPLVSFRVIQGPPKLDLGDIVVEVFNPREHIQRVYAMLNDEVRKVNLRVSREPVATVLSSVKTSIETLLVEALDVLKTLEGGAWEDTVRGLEDIVSTTLLLLRRGVYDEKLLGRLNQVTDGLRNMVELLSTSC